MEAFVRAVSTSPSIVTDLTGNSQQDIGTDAQKVVTMVLVVVVG